MRLTLLFLAAFCTMADSRASAIDIVFRTEAVPNSTIVRLGDLAEIHDADAARVEELARLPLMPAPAPDAQLHVRAQTIRDLLAAQGHDLSVMRFTGAAQTTVRSIPVSSEGTEAAPLGRPQTGFRSNPLRATQPTRQRLPAPLSSAAIKELEGELADALVRHIQTKSGATQPWRAELKLGRQHAERLQQATTPVEIEGGAAPWIGKQQFLVSFQSPMGDVRFPVEATVTEVPMVVRARRALARGETITSAAVEFVPLPEGTVIPGQQTLATSVEETLECEILRPVREGELLSTEMYAPPMLVRRGEAVTVHSGGGGIRIRVLAKSRVDGRLGEIIEVETPDTKERYTARVVGPRQLAVLSVVAEGAASASRRANSIVR